MSVVGFEPRSFMEGGYPPMDDHPDNTTPDAERYSDPTTEAVVTELATVTASFSNPPPTFSDAPAPEPRLDIIVPPAPTKEESPPRATTPSRVKSILKPDREVTKNGEGKYVCTFPGCTEEVREFGRKCEWNKHMDKHDRPYKCAAEGCEKLPGFTYSGGLLRHEREVHGKHGGPKNSFNCPHPTCKRHAGKGFSRLENLNEHLRRVHTQGGGPNATSPAGAGGETDDAASDGAGAAPLVTNGTSLVYVGSQKRKRDVADDSTELRDEMKRIRQENIELKRQVEAQTMQTVAMMQKIAALQEALQEARMVTPMSTTAMATATMI